MASPLKTVLLNNSDSPTATRMPSRYRLTITSAALPPKKAAVTMPYTGSLAEHDMKGAKITVSLRSRSLGSVRVAMMAGTLQPKPTMSGAKLRPESPILRSSLSIM